MLTIDGSFGEGGGQMVRSSLALSMVTVTPVRIENVRAGRNKPGLLRQHLTALQAAAHLSGAAVEGDTLGSTDITFVPGPVVPGTHRFAVGSAGSATLVLQTILPALLTADAPSEITLEGGTHNPYAPPFDFLQRAYLPLVSRMGPTVTAELVHPGFFPKGGGRFVARITPAPQLTPIDLYDRGAPVGHAARAIVVRLPRDIAERELRTVRRVLGWSADVCTIEAPDRAPGTGNAVVLSAEHEHVTEVFTGFGQRGKPAEAVAEDAATQCKQYLAGDAAAGEYLTDQLMLPLALAGGGGFTATHLSLHATTHIDLIRRFLDVDITVTEEASDRFRVVFKGA